MLITQIKKSTTKCNTQRKGKGIKIRIVAGMSLVKNLLKFP